MTKPRVGLLMLTTEERLQDGTSQWARAAVREQTRHYPNVTRHTAVIPGRSIGFARNELLDTISNLRNPPDIIVHWDDDDWSAPRRVADQVEALLESRAECVGYNEMLFCERPTGEAWRYLAAFAHYMLGTSMCYWLETWRRHPFASGNAGCDDLHWASNGAIRKHSTSGIDALGMPLMVATVHGGNTACRIDPDAHEWERTPQYDGLVGGIFGAPPADWAAEQREATHTYGMQRQRV